MASFDREKGLQIRGASIEGPWRRPRQLLAAQHLSGAGSIHDEATAFRLGYDSGAIEGPTHFSQFVPLCARAWGQKWFETGCLSAKFKTPSYAGEDVRASLQWPVQDAGLNEIRLTKRDGTEVLRGSASIGPDHPRTPLRENVVRPGRRSSRRTTEALEIGRSSGRIKTLLSFDEPLGDLYPFSLEEKLAVMTEPLRWYTKEEGHLSPWGRPIIPMEMISVLLRHSSGNFPFRADYPFVQMFAAQEICLHAGPLFVNKPYEVEHAVVSATHSKHIESVWIDTNVFIDGTESPVATMLLNIVGIKDGARRVTGASATEENRNTWSCT